MVDNMTYFKNIKIVDATDKTRVAEVTANKRLKVDSLGTSEDYKNIVYNSEKVTLLKGVRNELELFPNTKGENQEDSHDTVASLNGTNTDIGQVFKLTTGIDNIYNVHTVLDVSSSNDVILDNFETYANEAALDAAWVQSNTVDSPATLITSDVAEGTQAMEILITNGNSDGDTITKTFTSQDWSTSGGIRLWFKNDRADKNKEVFFQISDGTNTSEILLSSSANGIWERLRLDFGDFYAVGAAKANLTTITSMIFTNTRDKVTASYYIDNITRVTEDYGTIDVELYDFGTNANPTTLGTPMTLDDGTTKSTIILKEGINDFLFSLRKGVTTTALTADNYYGFVITNRSDINTTIGVRGNSTANNYTNGFAFISTDNGTTITNQTNGDLAFIVSYHDECYNDGFHLTIDNPSGDSDFLYFVEDKSTEKITNFITTMDYTNGRQEIVHNWKNEDNIDIFIAKGNEIELKYNDDSSSTARKIAATFIFRFKERNIHG